MASAQQLQMVNKMRRLNTRIVAAILMLAPIIAAADIGDGLDDMYISTGSEPAIYDSQRRMGLDAGYLRLRSPINTFNIVNFSPPRVDVGCGGLDLYGGSFSFINADQFRQMLRQIGANALGYAFKLALSSMCQNCAAELTQLMNDIQEKTQMQVDTCKWGAGLAINGAEALGFSVDEKYKKEATGDGDFTDVMEAWNSMFSDPGEDKSDGDASGADPAKNEYGNWTWNALDETNAAARFSFLAGNISHEELLMNIAGTFMLRAPGAGDPPGNLGDLQRLMVPRLNYTDFKQGKTASAGSTDDAWPMMTCGNARCTLINFENEWSFKGGVDEWVSGRLQTAANHMANPVTAATPHPALMQDFIGSLPFSVMRHMLVLQGNQPALDAYVRMLSPYVSKVYTGNLALQLAAVIKNAYDDSEVPEMPATIRENIEQFEREAREDIRSAGAEYAEVWKNAEELVAANSRRHGDPGFGIDASRN